jgi:hypothetical protein
MSFTFSLCVGVLRFGKFIELRPLKTFYCFLLYWLSTAFIDEAYTAAYKFRFYDGEYLRMFSLPLASTIFFAFLLLRHNK